MTDQTQGATTDIVRKAGTKPILDSETGQEYTSMYQAGKALGPTLAAEANQDRLVWFALARKYPDRFKTLSNAGTWVALNDPDVPVIHRTKKSETDDNKRARLLAELGEIDARRAAAGTSTNGAAAPKVKATKSQPAVAATSEGDEAEVEEEAAAPVKPKQKPVLAGAMKKG